MIDVGLILARFLHYTATATLAGVSFFPFYAYADSEPETLNFWRRKLLLWTAVVALFSGLFWFVFSAATMSGSLADLANPEVVWAVLRDTTFGVVWTARMFLAVAIVGVTAMCLFSTATVSRDSITPLLAAALLGSLAGTGHSQIEEGWASVIHVASDVAHLLAAGAWLGGLVPLGFILLRYDMVNREVRPIDVDRILLGFSGMGYVAVATLIGSGLINGWFLVGSVANLLRTPYGQILIGKLVLFAAMLALAIANRLWLVPLMSRTRTDTSGGVWASRLRNHVLGEQFLGWMVLLIVSILGTMRPAIVQ
ncbi:MAG: copper resistance D family protein [Bradyrhizobiaceae bacterium]|nr:MAG: copper resistance D family protein [Bradyrhizobiaceae bacterium]